MKERKLPIVQLMREEAQIAFKKWEQSPLKIEY
jgi:hypothetical protein